MSGRSTRPRAKVDYARNNYAGTPRWLRPEDRHSDEDDSDSPEPAFNESQKDAKRKSAPQGKAGHKPAKTATRTSAPADTGTHAADRKPAAAVVIKQIEFKVEDEVLDTELMLPLSKRLEKHKRSRGSNDDEPADGAVGQEPANKKQKNRPASAPSGPASKPQEDSSAEQAAQTKSRNRPRKSAPAVPGSQKAAAAAAAAEGKIKAAADEASKPSLSTAGHQEFASTDQVSGSLNKGKQHKQKTKKESIGAATDAPVADKTAAGKQTSGSGKGKADTKTATKTKSGDSSRSHSSGQLEEPNAAAAATGRAKQNVSGGSESTAKQAVDAPPTAAPTTAKSGASKKGSKSAATKAAADTAEEPEPAAAKAPVASKKSKSKASSAAAAAAAETAVADNIQPVAVGAKQQQKQLAAADAPAADKPRADNKQPAAPPTPAGSGVVPVNDDAAAAGTAAAGASGGAGSSEFAKLQAEYRRLYAMYDELKSQKIQAMEGMVQEQDSYIVKMGEEARQLVDLWRKEAEHQRHTAASIKAPETARHIKQLQDNAIADKAALLEKDRALLKLQAEVAELKQRLLEAGARPEMVDAAVQVDPEVAEVTLDPLTAEAAAAAAAEKTPAPPGRQFAACQFPTPAAPVVPSPGVGMQFPSPAAAAGESSGAAKHASTGSELTDAAAAAAAAAVGHATMAGSDAAAAAAAPAAAVLRPAGQVPYTTPGGINASMFPAHSNAAAAVAATRQAEVSAAAQQPLPVSSDSAAAGTATDPSTVRKQLQLSESHSKSRGGGSSPIRGLVIAGTSAKVGIARSTAAQGRVAPAAKKPYNTPGGINAFMFNAATATGADAGALAAAGEDAGDSVVGFAFQNGPNAANNMGDAISLIGAAAEPQQPQQANGMQVGFFAGIAAEVAAGGSGGNDAGGGSGGLQNSDNGSFILDNRQLGGLMMISRGLGMQNNNRKRPAAGLLSPPPAPHSTPVGPGRTPAAVAAARSVAAAAMMRQQQGTPASTGSLQRVQMREKQLAELRAALQQGVSPMCEKGAAAVAADDERAAAAATAAAPVVVSRVAGVSPGRLTFSPMAAGHTPASTPASTPAALAAAAQKLPLERLAAALAAAAAAATPVEPPPVAPAPQAAAAAAAADVDVGFAGFFSPQIAAAAAPAPIAAAAKRAVAGYGLQPAAGADAAAVEATPLSGVVLPAVGTSDRRQTSRRARMSPQRVSSTGGRRRSASASKHLMPLTYLCDFDPQLLDHGNIQYKHNATGFTFQLGPALSTLTAPTPMTAQTSDAAWNNDNDDDDDDDDTDEWEEEISFVPVALGTAEQALPEFLKEPITFAPAAKPQFMKLLFQALADATKAAAAAAAEQQHRGGRAARNRRSSKHQQKQQQEAAAAAAAECADTAQGAEQHADKENAAARAAAVAASGKATPAANTAVGAVVGGHRQ